LELEALPNRGVKKLVLPIIPAASIGRTVNILIASAIRRVPLGQTAYNKTSNNSSNTRGCHA
jgi:hypothetical protein